MSLAEAQRAFIAEIAADDDSACSSLGMEIYRNAYRARLVAALEVSFERTRAWVGEEAFAAAAAHHVLTHPPRSWTLDAYGAPFPATLETLFTEDREVAELAWLEWHMQQAFGAPDQPTLTGADLAALGLEDADWEVLCFTPAAGYAQRPVIHDLAALWHDPAAGLRELEGDHTLVVWRLGHAPHFRLIPADAFAALDALQRGVPFGAVAAAQTDGPERIGTWLAQWIGEGLFSAAACAQT